VTGPSNAEKGIVVIFDVFGYYPQTLQGADIFATSNEHEKYRVLVPDWFDGKPMPLEWCVLRRLALSYQICKLR
jgi:dienelactone hydrolase